MNLGDQITKAEISAVSCPVHGEFCELTGPFTPCRARVKKAIQVKHDQRTSQCTHCATGRGYHVHLGDQP